MGLQTTDSTGAERDAAIVAAVADIRGLEATHRADGPDLITRDGVEAIRDRLLELAALRRLFPLDAFPHPEGGLRSVMYRLSPSPDHRVALYAQVARGAVKTPPHDHQTWAVVVGFHGHELNRFYDRVEVDGAPAVRQRAEYLVEAGTGVAMLPRDVHSVHIDGPSLNLHCYGMALERLADREFFHASQQAWKPFTSMATIRDLPQGRT